MSAVELPVNNDAPGTAERIPGLWKTPGVMGVFTVLVALLVLTNPRSGDSTFRWARDGDWFTIPDVSLPANLIVWTTVTLCLLCAAYAAWCSFAGRKTPLVVVAAFAVFAVSGFLAWAVAGKTLPVVGLLSGALALAVPLVFGALGGVLGERAGVVNIAIDGQLLFGAFGAAIAASLTGSPWVGLIAAMIAGMLVALLLGLFAITYWVQQVIVGVVLNVLVIGFTSFMFSQVLSENAALLNNPPHFPRWEIPLLSGLPVLGPIFFRQTVLVYLMYAAVFLVAWALYRSKWGLRVRAVGEHPKAADTVGINVIATRYRTVLLAGAIAGIGGATYTLVSVPSFGREMTGGAGYIALAAVIFGKWDPIRATLAALLFGFASNVESVLSVIGSPVPSQFMLMLPYIVTIFAVAGLVGHSRAPAATGVPYRKA
ncbi:nucleoside ABC transporter membrane protein [Nocardioides albertanoniae]|uniref:Nucleoside ABC transporter membrane protein n=1 Tax=Nocardioides albertanoniae TaxID=1175486 RepID=A0A543AC02_9ACTN|nr:ABC transporter permease [Nocardioides albertanoniae]TQL70125.1 nucleoside ABC transporter membrane protein [Nocardioides albertanoniae]